MQYGMIKVAVICFCSVFLASAQAKEVQLDSEGKPCEDMVDLSETGQFHRLHFDCAKTKTPSLQAPESAPVKTAVDDTQPGPAIRVAASNPLSVQAGFVLSRGSGASTVSSTIDALFLQMSKTCDQGWRKRDEWVTAAGQPGHYVLHFAYECINK